MKANELMIGDYVLTSKGVTLVENINEEGINGQFDMTWAEYHFEDYSNSNNEYLKSIYIKPIPLTRKLLEDSDIEIKYLDDHYLQFCIAIEDDKFEYVIDSTCNDFGDFIYTTKEIQYLHEYQQLVRIFEKRELTIKL